MERVFRYSGLNEVGEALAGRVEGTDRADALRRVPREVRTLLSFNEPAARLRFDALLAIFLHWVYGLTLRKARMRALQSMALFIRNDMPLPKALALAMASCPNPRLREAFRGILLDITDHGFRLWKAMENRSDEFSKMLVGIVRAGEDGGAGFALAIEKAASIDSRGVRVGGKIQRALYYPTFVFLGIIGLIVFMVVVFIPQFSGIATDLGSEVPTSLLIVSRVGSFLINPIVLTFEIGSVAVAVIIFRAMLLVPTFAYTWDSYCYRIWQIGRLRRLSTVSLIARLLGAMLTAKVPYDAALGMLTSAIDSPVFVRALEEIRSGLRTHGGHFTHHAMRTGVFDAEFLTMVGAGEQVSKTGAQLERVASEYEEMLLADLDALTSILEPVLIVVLGLAVMLILSILYGSLYSMYAHIK